MSYEINGHDDYFYKKIRKEVHFFQINSTKKVINQRIETLLSLYSRRKIKSCVICHITLKWGKLIFLYVKNKNKRDAFTRRRYKIQSMFSQ